MAKSEIFTPAPWRLVYSMKGRRLDCWILGKDPSAQRELQVISLNDMHPIKEHLQRRLADMKLISAAPEMYAELKRIFERDGYESIKILLDKINSQH